MDKYNNHIEFIVEDKAYRSILNGIFMSINFNLDSKRTNIKPCGGYEKVFKNIEERCAYFKNNEKCYIIAIIDFDDKNGNSKFNDRMNRFKDITKDF